MDCLNVTLVGFGRVGSALGSLLLHDGDTAINLNVQDPSPEIEGAYLDLCHTASFYPWHRTSLNDAGLFADSDVVFHAAGTANTGDASRLSVAAENVSLTHRVFGDAGFRTEPWVIVITNPVDVITWHTFLATGLDHRRVLGVGTLLDTVRLEYYLSQALGVEISRVRGWVLGEHGDTQVPVWSRTTVDGRPLRGKVDERVLARCAEETRTAALRIRENQPGTWWGVASCAYQMLRTLRGGRPREVPLSVRPEGAWVEGTGGGDLCLGLPTRLHGGGYDLLLPFELEPDELRALRASADVLRRHL